MGLWAVVRRLPVSIGYLLVLATVSAWLLRQDPTTRDRVVGWTSTNLDNLADGRIDTLVTSAFVVASADVWEWLPLFGALLVSGEWLLGSRRLAGTLLAGNVIATLIVAAGLAIGVREGWIDGEIASAADTGVSYAAVAVLAGVTAALPPRLRGAWTGFWVAVPATAAIVSPITFTAVGHCVAFGVGFALAAWFADRIEPVPPGWWLAALLGLAAVFGVAVVGWSPQLMLIGPFGMALGYLAGRCRPNRGARTRSSGRSG